MTKSVGHRLRPDSLAGHCLGANDLISFVLLRSVRCRLAFLSVPPTAYFHGFSAGGSQRAAEAVEEPDPPTLTGTGV
jgi:hypothetical protein